MGHRQRHPARAGNGQMRGAGALPCLALVVGGDFTCHTLFHTDVGAREVANAI